MDECGKSLDVVLSEELLPPGETQQLDAEAGLARKGCSMIEAGGLAAVWQIWVVGAHVLLLVLCLWMGVR